MKCAYALLIALLVCSSSSCREKKETTAVIGDEKAMSTEFNQRIEMTIAMLPLTPEENLQLRAKLAQTPLPPGKGYDVLVYAKDGTEFAGNMLCPKHEVTAATVDTFYTSVFNASAYAILSPLNEGRPITDRALNEWRKGVGTAWLDCSGQLLEEFGTVIKDPNFDPMVRAFCDEYILRKAFQNLWITPTWDDELPAHTSCFMHCSPSAGTLQGRVSAVTPVEDGTYRVLCKVDCPDTIAVSRGEWTRLRFSASLAETRFTERSAR